MGTKVAPPYASLFLGLFEETYIFNKYPELITIFLRFLDGIFFIWDHGEEELHQFFKYLNSIHIPQSNSPTNSQGKRLTF